MFLQLQMSPITPQIHLHAILVLHNPPVILVPQTFDQGQIWTVGLSRPSVLLRALTSVSTRGPRN